MVCLLVLAVSLLQRVMRTAHLAPTAFWSTGGHCIKGACLGMHLMRAVLTGAADADS